MRIKYRQAIKESEEELSHLEQSLRGQKAADRVRMLRLLKSEKISSLKDAAPLVGYSLAQMTRWWERYRAAGLAELLKQHKPAGKPSRLRAEAWEGLMTAMRAGQIATMQDACLYLQREWGISYKNGKSLWWLFQKHRVKWKTGRRHHQKANLEQQNTFKKNFANLLSQLKRVVAFDEGRFGLKTWLRRRWCPLGERPPWIVNEEYEWLWLYAAVEPSTGTGVFLLLPMVEGACLELFLQHLHKELGEGSVAVVLDNAPSHHSGEVHWPAEMSPLSLPPYSPELNPAEQIFRHLRKRLSNQIFSSLQELQEALIDELQQFWEHPSVLLHLTGYPWWLQSFPSNISSSPSSSIRVRVPPA